MKFVSVWSMLIIVISKQKQKFVLTFPSSNKIKYQKKLENKIIEMKEMGVNKRLGVRMKRRRIIPWRK